jgi:hypothetical protein
MFGWEQYVPASLVEMAVTPIDLCEHSGAAFSNRYPDCDADLRNDPA